MQKKLPIEQRMQEKRALLGYMPISKDTVIPKTFEDIHLQHDSGPVNIAVMKPFRIWQSPINYGPEQEGKEATLEAFQKLLLECRRTVEHNKNSFVLYVEQRTLNMDIMFVGGIYKL